MKRFLILFLFSAFALYGCAPRAASSDVLTSTTFLADMTRNVAGNRLTVEALLPIGADPHSYQPAPQDIAKIENARLLILNGAEYERFMEPLLANNAGKVAEASSGLTPRSDPSGEHGIDPHFWLDPNMVIVYVENIRAALTELDPAGVEVYQANAATYTAQLQELDAWIQAQANLVPAERRLLVTNHEALGYFAARYGFTVVGAVVPSVSGSAAPSAQEMSGLIDQIRQLNVPAIFLDAADSDALARQISSETGAAVVSDLHLESLTDGAPAPTYIEMMKHNATRIVEALR
ncbi:MAG: metal ABC transporter substrate-binding protein [Anaerolineales bacterium]